VCVHGGGDSMRAMDIVRVPRHSIKHALRCVDKRCDPREMLVDVSVFPEVRRHRVTARAHPSVGSDEQGSRRSVGISVDDVYAINRKSVECNAN
jgi:hypothetical protein